ncbi:MAG: PQQ-binding-like beta-propeller repeat protein, partial [Syntrophomonas sp.]|nr:PQQ-binding-like beta-propeller repeat protein [Syntrophomonas sp.]
TQAAEAQQSAQISWKLPGLGKLSGNMILAPNGKLLIPLGNKIVCVDLQGKVLWETKGSSSGAMGQPIIGENDSIYAANASSVQETKLNGTNAWSFSVYSGAKGSKAPLLASGLNNILYLPLPNALYAVNLSGHYVWMLSPWDSSEANNTKLTTTREFLACTADKQAFYVVYGEKGSYRLAAISNQGKFLWTYWLGDITRANLLTAEDGRLIVTASFNKSSGSTGRKTSGSTAGSTKKSAALKTGKVYSFRIENGSSPEWQYTLKTTTDLSMSVLYKNKILYLTGGNKLFALNAGNGSIIWEEPLLNLVSPPVVDPQTERIYAGSSDGALFAVNQTGRMDWNRTLDGSIDRAPLVGPDGFLYVFTQKGSLYKIRDNMK